MRPSQAPSAHLWNGGNDRTCQRLDVGVTWLMLIDTAGLARQTLRPRSSSQWPIEVRAPGALPRPGRLLTLGHVLIVSWGHTGRRSGAAAGNWQWGL